MSHSSLEYPSVSQLHVEQGNWHQYYAIYTHVLSPKDEQCASKRLILVLYQMLMLSEIFGKVLGSSNIESDLQRRKLLGETSKGFGIQTGPPLPTRKHLEKG